LGVTLKEMYLDKFEVLSKLGRDFGLVQNPHVDFLPLSYINTMTPSLDDPEIYEKEIRMLFPGGRLHVPDYQKVSLQAGEYIWDFMYCPASLKTETKYGENLKLGMGIIFLEDAALSTVVSHPKWKHAYRLMQNIADVFSHDITGHATLDFAYGESPETMALKYGSPRLFRPFLVRKRNEMNKKYFRRFSWEVGLLKLQQDLFYTAVTMRRGIIPALQWNIRSFKKLLLEITQDAASVEYFLRLYAWMLTRIIHPAYSSLDKIIGDAQIGKYMRDFAKDRNEFFFLREALKCGQNFPLVVNHRSKLVFATENHYISRRHLFIQARKNIRKMNKELSQQ
jgi:hypothetical protein